MDERETKHKGGLFNMSREPRRATASEIFRYAFGGLGSNVAYILMMSYLTYYMTDVFGISAYAISARV